MSVSVATRNPFALLSDEDRPPSPPPPAAPASPTTQQTSAPPKRSKSGPASRGGKYYPRGGSRPNPDREAPTSEDTPAAPDVKQRRFDGERREGRGRGRGGPRGRGRPFDKHSATGKTDSDKKIHNGWGGDDGNAELKTEEAATLDAVVESTTVLNDWSVPADSGADGWDAPPQEPGSEQAPDAEKPEPARRKERDGEEEDNTLTLDQYLAQQKEKEFSVIPKLETRKVNEGADDAIPDGATRLEKGEGETYFSGKAKSAPKARSEKKEKIFLEIDAHFERPARGRGRGDRGEGRGRDGGRGRGGRERRVPNGSTSVVNVDDETAFPSLS